MAQTATACHLYLLVSPSQTDLEQLADACTRNHTGHTPSEQCIGWTGAGDTVDVLFAHSPTLAAQGFIKCRRLTLKSADTLKALDMAFVRSQGQPIGGVAPGDCIGLHQPLVSAPTSFVPPAITDICILELDARLDVRPDHITDANTTLVVVDVPRYSEMDITDINAICESAHALFEHAHVMHASQILRTWKRIFLQSIAATVAQPNQTLAQKAQLLCNLCVRVLRLPPQFMTDANAMSIYMAERVVDDTRVCLFPPTPAPQHASPKFPPKVGLSDMVTAVTNANISWETVCTQSTPSPGCLALCAAKDVMWLHNDPCMTVFGCTQHRAGALGCIASATIKKLVRCCHDSVVAHNLVWAIILRAATDDSPAICAALDIATGAAAAVFTTGHQQKCP